MDKRLTPPPLSTSARVNNIHTKQFFLSTFGDPPYSPLSTFININDIFFKFLFINFFNFFLGYDYIYAKYHYMCIKMAKKASESAKI